MISALLFPGVALRHRDMLRSFVWRDLASRYEGSLLGRLWPVVYPLMLLGIYHLVFAQILEIRFSEEHPLVGKGWITTFYMLSGILPWLGFADTIARSTNVVIENSTLIKKIAFPSELLPTYVSLAQLVHMMISMALLTLLYIIVFLFGVTDLSTGDGAMLISNLIYLPIPLFLQFVFSVGLGMLLGSINVFFRDLNQAMPVTLLLWMLLSPIFYHVAMVENVVKESGRTWILTVLQINPAFHLLEMYRAIYRTPFGSELSDIPSFPWASCGIFAAIAFGTFVIGHKFFVSTKGMFADEV